MILINKLKILLFCCTLMMTANWALNEIPTIGNILSNNYNYLKVSHITTDQITDIFDNDVLKVSFSLKEQVSSGYTFALTPSHNDIISITDKHCKTESGDEMLVIKKRTGSNDGYYDGYYSLTTVKEMSDIECSFNIRVFFVINNPTYKLTLTSPLYVPLTVDWTEDMYEGELKISIVPTDPLPSIATVSRIIIDLDMKSQSTIAGRSFLLKLSLSLTNVVKYMFSLTNNTKTKYPEGLASNCYVFPLDPKKQEIVATLNTQSSLKSTNTYDDKEIRILVNFLKTPFTQLNTNISCESAIPHTITSIIKVELLSNQFSYDVFSHFLPYDEKNNNTSNTIETVSSMVLNSKELPTFEKPPNSSYLSTLGKLKFDPSEIRLGIYPNLSIYHNQNVTSIITRTVGLGLLTEIDVNYDQFDNTCITIHGIETKPHEEVYMIENVFNKNLNTNFQGEYNNLTAEWILKGRPVFNTNQKQTITLFSTTLSELFSLKWYFCDDSLNNSDIKLNNATFFSSPGFYYSSLPLINSTIRVFTPSQMKSTSAITIEFKSIVNIKETVFEIEVPYIPNQSDTYSAFSICRAYNTTDVNKVSDQSSNRLLGYLDNDVKVLPERILKLTLKPFQYRDLVICKVFGSFLGDIDSTTGTTYNNNLSINGIPYHLTTYSSNENPFHIMFYPFLNDLSVKEYISTSNSDSNHHFNTNSLKEYNNIGIDTSNNNFNSLTDNSIPPTETLMNMTNQPELKIRIDHSKVDVFYVYISNIIATLSKNSNNELVSSFILKMGTILQDKLKVMLITDESGEMDNDIVYNGNTNLKFYIKNHPNMLGASLGDRIFMSFGLSFQNIPIILFTGARFELSQENTDFKTIESIFYQYVISEPEIHRQHDQGYYLTTHEEFETHFKPYSPSRATMDIIIKTKYPLEHLEIVFYENTIEPQFIDYIGELILVSSHHKLMNLYVEMENGKISCTFVNLVDEFDSEIEIHLSMITYINLPYFKLSYNTKHQSFEKKYLDGLRGSAYIIGLPNVIFSGFELDTGNINFDYPSITEDFSLGIDYSNEWLKKLYLNNRVICPIDNYSLLQLTSTDTNKPITPDYSVESNLKNKKVKFGNIPTNSNLNITFSYLQKSGKREQVSFQPLIYVPDLSHLVNIQRVSKVEQGFETIYTVNNNSDISENDEDIIFAFTGYIFSPLNFLSIDFNNMPIEIITCTQNGDQSYINNGKPHQSIIKSRVTRVFNNDSPNPLNYDSFTVICEFMHIPTQALREERYTGVLKATLKSDTLGQITETSLKAGFKLNIEQEEESEQITINSLLTIRNTPSTGPTSKDVATLLDRYSKSTSTITGNDKNKVFIDTINTYPVKNGKHDTDVDIVIVSDLDEDVDLSLEDVKNINDQFIIDTANDKDDKWDVSVSPPTYSVDIVECRNKCGVGCRLCGNGVSCTNNNDCLFNHCDTETFKCTDKPYQPDDTKGTNSVFIYHSNIIHFLFFLLTLDIFIF